MQALLLRRWIEFKWVSVTNKWNDWIFMWTANGSTRVCTLKEYVCLNDATRKRCKSLDRIAIIVNGQCLKEISNRILSRPVVDVYRAVKDIGTRLSTRLGLSQAMVSSLREWPLALRKTLSISRRNISSIAFHCISWWRVLLLAHIQEQLGASQCLLQ